MPSASARRATYRDYRMAPWPHAGTSRDWPSSTVASNLLPVWQELQGLMLLGDNWNSYGARRISTQAISRALGLLQHLAWTGTLPEVIPMSRGGVKLEWGADDDEIVELEFDADGPIRILVEADGKMWEAEAQGYEDPSVADALLWAEKIS